MEISTQKYDPQKIERLKQYLEKQTAKEQARYYEIYVDTIKAVPRTTDLAEFDTYTEYLDDTTEKVKIKIYSTHPTSAQHDLHTFVLNKLDDTKESAMPSLQGIDIKAEVSKEVALAQERWAAEQVSKERDDLKKKLDDAETYIDTLEDLLEKERQKKNSKEVAFGNVASYALEGLAMRNIHKLAKLPGAEALAGLFPSEEGASAIAEPAKDDAEVSFKKKVPEQALSDEDQQYLLLLKQMQQRFDPNQMQKVMHILNYLGYDPSLIDIVFDLFQKSDQPQPPNS